MIVYIVRYVGFFFLNLAGMFQHYYYWGDGSNDFERCKVGIKKTYVSDKIRDYMFNQTFMFTSVVVELPRTINCFPRKSAKLRI